MGYTPMGANSLHEMTPIYMGGHNENGRVVSLESVPIHLKVCLVDPEKQFFISSYMQELDKL